MSVVALRDIEPGEEITISCMIPLHLLDPADQILTVHPNQTPSLAPLSANVNTPYSTTGGSAAHVHSARRHRRSYSNQIGAGRGLDRFETKCWD